ncbi:hypothetical protein [Paraglaciecola sp.]|uniref:hypothetical protein n=1 Tax=Paraglaciecola sp. TaxID=1920173 RepID=UPI003262F4B9
MGNTKRSHDIPTVLRFFSIVCIVSEHFDFFDYGGGGAYLLLLLVGFNIATFKIDKLLSSDSVKGLLIMFIKVLIPTIGYILILNIFSGSFNLESVLLVSSITNNEHPKGYGFWFIEVYIQILVFLYALLSFSSVRQFTRNNIKQSALILLVTSCLLLLITKYGFNLTYSYQRLPWLLLFMFSFGFYIKFVSGTFEKIVTAFAFVLTTFAFNGGVFDTGFFTISFLILLFLPSNFRINKVLMKPVSFVSAGSLFIYLTHFQLRTVFETIGITSPLINTFLAVLFGSIIFHIYNNIFNKKILNKIISAIYNN